MKMHRVWIWAAVCGGAFGLSAEAQSQAPILSNIPSERNGAPSDARLVPLSLEAGKPTEGKIERFLQGGVRWGSGLGDEQVILAEDGQVTVKSGGNIVNQGMVTCQCTMPARLKTSGSKIEFGCHYLCNAYQPGSERDPTRLSSESRRFRWSVLYVTEDEVLYKDQDGKRWLISTCTPDQSFRGVRRHCRSWRIDLESESYLVEVIRGAEDTALASAVFRRLEGAPTRLLRRDGILVDGGRAEKSRRESQVFYVVPPGASTTAVRRVREVAEDVAGVLREVIGPVEVEQWPGSWNYDVVVVVGSVAKGSGKGH